MELKNLTKRYRKNIIFKNQNFDFTQKGIYYIKGESGIGKTTLLNILAGLDLDYTGEFYWQGNIVTKNSKTFDNFRSTHLGFSFQQNIFIPHQTVAENLHTVLNLTSFSKEEKEKLIDDALTKLEILDYKDRKLKSLSGGQKQRVNFARAIVNNPDVIIADEPTASLDEDNKIIVLEILKKLSAEKTIIIVSHDQIVEDYADIIITLTKNENEGYIVNQTEKLKVVNKKQKRKTSVFKNLKFGSGLIKNKTLLFPIILILVGFCVVAILILSLLLGVYQAKISYYSTNINDNVLIVSNSCTSEVNVNPYNVPMISCDEKDINNGISQAGIDYLENSSYVNNYYIREGVGYGKYENQTSANYFYYSEITKNFNPEDAQYDKNVPSPDTPNVIDLGNTANMYFTGAYSRMYYPIMKTLPVQDLAKNEKFTNEVEDAIVVGEMPDQEYEVVVPTIFVNYQFKTEDYASIIGKTVENCAYKEYSYQDTSYIEDTKCHDYTITGVYESNSTIGTNLYIPFSNDFVANYFPESLSLQNSFVVELDSAEHKDEFIAGYVDAVNPETLDIYDTTTNLTINQQTIKQTIKVFVITSLIISILTIIFVGSIYRIRFKHQIKMFALLRVFGYSKTSLTTIIIGESIVIITVSMIISILIAFATTQTLNYQFVSSTAQTLGITYNEATQLVSNPFVFDANLIIFLIILIIIVTIAMSIINILFLYRKNLVEVLRRK